MSVCGVAGRRRRSAVARVLVEMRNTSLFAAPLTLHSRRSVLLSSSCVVLTCVYILANSVSYMCCNKLVV